MVDHVSAREQVGQASRDKMHHSHDLPSVGVAGCLKVAHELVGRLQRLSVEHWQQAPFAVARWLRELCEQTMGLGAVAHVARYIARTGLYGETRTSAFHAV